MVRFEELDHTADWSFRAYGADLPQLFENAAYAVFALEGAPMEAGAAPEIERPVAVQGLDRQALLVNWLSELLYMQESFRETYRDFHVDSLSPTHLQAHATAVRGGKIDKLVKAVTYHDLAITQTPAGWQAVVVVDV
jgi:SHS2 domain-containing protein